MVDEKLRQVLDEIAEEAIIFDSYAYDNSIVGVTEDNKIVYDYNKMVNELMQETGWDVLEAMEWIDYNTIRSIPYLGNYAPVVIEYSRKDIDEMKV